jgi:hypothetical protein
VKSDSDLVERRFVRGGEGRVSKKRSSPRELAKVMIGMGSSPRSRSRQPARHVGILENLIEQLPGPA